MLYIINNKSRLLLLSLSLLCNISVIWCDIQKSDEIACVINETNIASTNNSLWRTIQADTRNAVVQVFSIAAKFDWCEPYRTPAQGQSRGSGFFINEDGHIITNAHVVKESVAIFIGLPELGKRHLKATIIGVCPILDIALLQLDEPSLAIVRQQFGSVSYLKFGDSDLVQSSDDVLTLGYPLGLEYLKSTAGVISGRIGYYIQIDAAINPGSSGGPLLNKDGLTFTCIPLPIITSGYSVD